MSRKKSIAVDMDEVVADVMPKFYDMYAERFGRRPALEELEGVKMHQLEGASWIRDALWSRGFFRDLPMIEGAAEGLEFLRKHYEIYFVTAAMEFRNSFEDKYDWLHEHLPWVHWRNIVFCGDKSIIATDYMIDDHAFNLRTFRGKGLLFDALHNRRETEFLRVRDWNEVIEYFKAELEA